jgi:CBS domain containing-hemolysin-like protein
MKFNLKSSIRWSIFISAVTFAMAFIFTVVSTTVLEGVTWGIGMVIVILLVLNGIFFDVLGLSAAAASEAPFHGMASEKVKGSKHAIQIVRNADRFSNFCNDVIGDISSVISGAAGAAVVLKLVASFGGSEGLLSTVVGVIFTALVSALTVGGKAMGKSFAIHYSTRIILTVGKVFYFLEARFGIVIFKTKNNNKNKHNGKRGNKRARSNQPA